MIIISFDVGIKNLAFCIMDYEKKIHRWENLCIVPEEKKCKEIKIDKLINSILRSLDKNFYSLQNVSIIFIENQPSMKNPVMKSVQTVIHSFFEYSKIKNNYNYEINLVSATSKLKIDFFSYPEKILSMKNKYLQKKKKSIFLCEKLLKEMVFNESFFEFFQKSKKKDDLADAFLYIIYYLQNKKH